MFEALPRRALLAGLPAAVAIGAMSSTSAATVEDPLGLLGVQFEAAWRDQVKTFDRLIDDMSDAASDACDAAYDRTKVLAAKIEAARATSLEGLIVKARAASWCHQGDTYSAQAFGAAATQDKRLAATIVRDLISMSVTPLPEITRGLT